MDAEDETRSESSGSEEHEESSFERWLDERMGNDSELLTLWRALREVLVAQIGEGKEITATGVFAVVLSTITTLQAEHGKLKEGSEKAKKVTVTKPKEAGVKSSNKPDAFAIIPSEVTQAMRDHSEQLSAASMTRIAAAARLLHYVTIKLPSSTAWNTLPMAAPVLSAILTEQTPHTVAVPALKALSILLCHVPSLLGATSTHLAELYSLALKLAISGKPKVRKRAIRSVFVILQNFSSHANTSGANANNDFDNTSNAMKKDIADSSASSKTSKSGKKTALKSAAASSASASASNSSTISPTFDALCKATSTIVSSGFRHASKNSTTIALYTLELVKHVIPVLPVSLQKTWCRECLGLLQLCSVTVTQCVFLTFESLFASYNVKSQSTKHFSHLLQKNQSHQAQSHGAGQNAKEKSKMLSSEGAVSVPGHPTVTSAASSIAAAHILSDLMATHAPIQKLEKSRQKLLVELINAIFDAQPGPLVPQPIEAYCGALAEGALALNRLDDAEAALEKTLPRLFKNMVEITTSGNQKTTQAATECLKRVVTGGLTANFLDLDLAPIERLGEGPNVKTSVLHQLAQLLLEGLQVTNHAQWPEIFGICANFFERLAASTLTSERLVMLHEAQQRQKAIDIVCRELLERIANLRTSDAPSRKRIDPVLKHALMAIGLVNFLNYVPISFPNIVTGDMEGSNLWLLAFLREHLSHAELSFFHSSMLNSATLLKAFSEQLSRNGRDMGAKHFFTIHDQVWALFPRFCNHPRDLSATFAMLAEPIGNAISSLPSVRLDLVHGLTQLILRTTNSINATKIAIEEFEREFPSDDDGGSMDTGTSTSLGLPNRDEISQTLQDRLSSLEGDMESIRPFSQNYLPLLFNHYVSPGSPDEKNALFGCIEAFLTITDSEELNKFYTMVVSEILTRSSVDASANGEDEETMNLMQKLTALSVAFVSYLSDSNLELLFKTVKPHLQKQSRHSKAIDSNLQKKSWKVLYAICERSPLAFYNSHLSDVQALLSHAELVGTSKISIVTSIASRMDPEQLMAWLQGRDESFKSKLTSSSKDCVLTPLPMIVMGWRETSAKTRAASADALEAIGKRLGPETLIALLVLGLSSSDDHFKASTVACFTLVIQRFSKELSAHKNGQQMRSLLQTATLLLDLNGAEIRGATLSLLRATIKPTPPAILTQALPAILRTLMSWNDALKTKYMREIRFLLEKFLKRLDYDAVAAAMPKAHIKFLQNINQRYLHQKKMKMRQQNEQRHKSKKHNEDGDDSDAEEVESGDKRQAAASTKKKGGANAMQTDDAWLMEDGNEAPIDFTSTSANKSVVSIDPSKAKLKDRPTSNPFQTAEDGRMVISESVYKSSKGGDARAGIFVTDEMADDLEGRMVSSKKRKRARDAEIDDSDEENEKSSASRNPNAMAISGSSSSSSQLPVPAGAVGPDGRKVWYDSKGFRDKPKKAKLDPTAAAKSQVDVYKSKKGTGGDAKRSGKSDPHAYVKHNPAFLNKRHRAQAVKQYESLIGKKKK